MRYLNATRTSFGEDRRVYKAGVGGVTSTQEVFNVNYDNGRVDVFLNGVRLVPDDDYTRTASGIGTSIDLVSDIGANNVLEVVGYQGINSGNALVEDNFVVGANSTGSGGAYSGSTTVFPVSNSAGDTVSVWRNGIKLVPTTDYTVQALANTVTLLSAASSADEITVQVVGALVHADFIRGADLQDDDAFGLASATKVASSESIKAYADTKLATSTASSTYQTITNSDRLAHQGEPHIIPGVLYPAYVASGTSPKLLDGTTTHGTGTYNGVAVSTAYGTVQADGRKYYYTNIAGSKPIKDPRIGGHFGSQRHKFKSLQLLEQETATHGNNVYSIDGREWIRLSGSHLDINNEFGDAFYINSDGFIEITGYFSEANLISLTWDSGRDYKWRIDGGSSTIKTTFNTGVSSPLYDRYVDAGSVANIGISQTLGIHTLKLEVDSGEDTYMYGIELIAQDTSNRNNIQIPSQDVVSYGKKFNVSGTPHYDPFTTMSYGGSGTTLSALQSLIDTDTSLGMDAWKAGTSNYHRPWNGGRIIKWVDSSGVIKTSVNMMPPNAQNVGTTASNAVSNAEVIAGTNAETINFNTSAIDHTQAEVAKTFNYREFGNGNANGGANGTYKDASMLDTTSRDIAYLMDDGLTSLSGHNLKADFSRATFRTDTTDDTYYVTFIGTGLTLTTESGGTAFGNGDDYDFFVDGVLVESFQNTDTLHEKTTIAQNLPFGSHILQMKVMATPAVAHIHAKEFTFHQPKRPPIPADACVIADYMLMADYVKRTVASEGNLSKGVRLVSCTRDAFYDIPAVGGTNWASPIPSHAPTGFRFYQSANSNAGLIKVKLPAFGTSMEIQSFNHLMNDFYVNGSSVDETDVTSGTNTLKFSTQDTASTLGMNTFEVRNGTNSDGNYQCWFIHTPIHTSSHYQTFETPYLHELVGGDRNMEQTNLVCSPDGKTWDEVTRDTSYLGNVCVVTTTDTGTAWETVVVFDEWRGSDYNYPVFNKFFAIAYDRLICLEDGFYNITSQSRAENGGTVAIKLNSNYVSKLITATSDEMLFGSSDINLKRGDTIQLYGEFGLGIGDAELYNQFTIKRLDK